MKRILFVLAAAACVAGALVCGTPAQSAEQKAVAEARRAAANAYRAAVDAQVLCMGYAIEVVSGVRAEDPDTTDACAAFAGQDEEKAPEEQEGIKL